MGGIFFLHESTKGNLLPKASQRQSIISLHAVGRTVRTNERNTPTSSDVTFVCGFSDHDEGISASPIDVSPDEVFTVAQLSETGYITISKLLASQRRTKQTAK